MGDLIRDLHFGVRLLIKSPTVTAVAILAIAFSIGANTIIFSIVNTSLLHPMPVGEARDVVGLFETVLVGGETVQRRMTDGNFVDYARDSQTLEKVVAVRSMGLPVTSSEEPLNPLMRRVSAAYFSVLGVEPLFGREFLEEEDRPGGPPVAILSYGFWQDFFGADPEILGRTVELAEVAYEIIGVIPAGFSDPLYSSQPVLWLPLALSADEVRRGHEFQRQATGIWAFGKIAVGRTLKDVKAEFERLAEDLRLRFPVANADRGVEVVPLVDKMVGSYRSKLLVLFVAVGFVLLIACSNVANLLLVKAIGRRKEIALRCALGASRWQIIRLLLVEGILLGLCGGVVGLFLALIGLDPILRWIPTTVSTMPRLTQVDLDWQVLFFTFGISILTGLVFGLFPARQLFRTDLESALSVGAVRGTADREGQRTRGFLVITEIAVSLVLLIGSGLLVQSFLELRNMPTGIDSSGVLSLRVTARGQGFEDREQWSTFFNRVLDHLRTLPGVTAAGGADILPMTMPWRSRTLRLADQPPAAPGAEPVAMVRMVTPGFFSSVAMPILKGRDFDDRDDAEVDPVVIINQSMAQRYWGERDPLSEEVILDDGDELRRRIVGIVGSTRHDVPDPEPKPVLFLPHAQNPMPTLSITLRGQTSDPLSLVAPVKRAVAEVSRTAPVYRFKPLAAVMDDLNWQARFMMRLLGGFAGLALLLVASGIYAVLSFLVAERRRELGVRLAIGASRLDILWMLLRNALRLAALGIAIGFCVSLSLAHLLEHQLFGVKATDSVTYVGMALLLLLLVVMASAVPAIRAMRVDPVFALRME